MGRKKFENILGPIMGVVSTNCIAMNGDFVICRGQLLKLMAIRGNGRTCKFGRKSLGILKKG